MAYARVRADVRYHSGPGGFCNVAELEFYEASMLGWTLVCVILGLGAAYVIGGSFYGQRTRAVASTSLLAALPSHSCFGKVAIVAGLEAHLRHTLHCSPLCKALIW